MIQMITYSGKEKAYEGENVVVSNLHSPKSLDEFDVNIINLGDKNIWHNVKFDNSTINIINDLESICTMLERSKKSINILMVPLNIIFLYGYDTFERRYVHECELKNMLSKFRGNILFKLSQDFRQEIHYEITETKIGNGSIRADFYFDTTENILTASSLSEKATTIGSGNSILTTLNICTYAEIIAFLKQIGLLKEKQTAPKWMEGICMFDDAKQIEIIRENQQKIQTAETNINEAKKVIAKNNEFKSILYTNGDELVKTVFEILETMLGVSLEGFEDKKKEDFKFDVDGFTYLGEIKGIGSNVKSQNITQLELHHQSYMDDHLEAKEDQMRMILIINHQRNVALPDRDPIDHKQIDLANKYGSLIVETYTLLKMFEKYLNGTLARKQCLELLSSNTGLLQLN